MELKQQHTPGQGIEVIKKKCILKSTRGHEEYVLGLGACSVPLAKQSDKHKHQALGVEGGPAEEEGKHNNH